MRIVHVASFYGPPSANFATALRHLGDGYQRAGHEFFLIGPGPRSTRTSTDHGTHITLPSTQKISGRPSLVPVRFAVLDTLTELDPDRLELSDRLTRSAVDQWARQRDVPVVRFAADPLGAIAVAPGVDLAEFSPLRWSPHARRTHSSGADILLVHVGGLGRRGSPALSVAALITLRSRGVNARLVLLGDGELTGRLARTIATLPVTVAGGINGDRQIAILLANADVALSPGSSRDGIGGLAALEALAAGTPVVATTLSDAARVLGEGSGEVTAATGAAFAAGVQRVLDRRVDERRAEARATAARYPWKKTVNALLDLHEFPGLLGADYQPVCGAAP